MNSCEGNMNKPLSLFTVFLACATATCGNRVAAQTTPSNSRSSNCPYRYTGGWNAVPTNPNIAAKSPLQADIRPPVQSPVVQAAFYQQPGSGMNLPGYPGNDGSGNLQPALPTGLPNNLPNSMPNALANGTSNPAPGRLSDVGMPNNMPPQNYAADNYAGSNQQLSPQPLQSQFDSYAREQQQVLPPAPMQSPYRTASTDLRAVQNDNQQYPAQQQNPLNDLRPVKPTMQRGFGTNAQQMDVATGYPFVSPPRHTTVPCLGPLHTKTLSSRRSRRKRQRSRTRNLLCLSTKTSHPSASIQLSTNAPRTLQRTLQRVPYLGLLCHQL
jgi:hypothetical protein